MIRHRLLGLVSALALAAACGSALAQVGTAITYQGQLKNAGSPVNTATDMEFSLWSADVGGSQIGSTVTSLNVPVSQGLFTASMDFGIDPYDSDQAVYLQISVRNPAGAGAYVPMGSRQRLTAAPYSAATRGINVNATGDVGIGTSTPGAKFEIAAGPISIPLLKLNQSLTTWGTVAAHDAFRYLTTAGGDPNLTSQKQFNVGAGGVSIGYPNVPGYGSGDALYVSGNVGIGTNAPGAKLDVLGSQGGRFRVFDFPDAGGTQLVAEFTGSGTLGPQLRFEDTEAGFMDIGLNAFGEFVVEGSDVAMLTVRNNGRHSIGPTSYGNVGLNIDVATDFGLNLSQGDAGKPGGGSWANTSDVRLKKNITGLDHSLDTLLSLRGVHFEYNDPKAIGELEGVRTGFIAQEVEQVVPDWVWTAEDGYKRITIRGFEAMAVEAMRELKTDNDTLSARVAALEARLNSAAAVPTVQSSVAWPALAACAGIGLIAVRRRSAAK